MSTADLTCVHSGAQGHGVSLGVDAFGGRGGLREEDRDKRRLSEFVPSANPRVSD